MFIWMTFLLTIVALPFALIFMKSPRVVLAATWVPDECVKRFPLSARTPIFHAAPREWYGSFLDSRRILATAFLGIVVLRDERPHLKCHEAVHVIQQSCFSPLLIGLVYLQDLLVFIPFRKYWVPGYWRRASVVEKIAYKIGDGIDV